MSWRKAYYHSHSQSPCRAEWRRRADSLHMAELGPYCNLQMNPSDYGISSVVPLSEPPNVHF